MNIIRSTISGNKITLTDQTTKGTLTIIVKEPYCPFDDDHQENPVVDLANGFNDLIASKELQLNLEGDSTMHIRKPSLVMLGRQSYDRVEVTVFSQVLTGDFSVKGTS